MDDHPLRPREQSPKVKEPAKSSYEFIVIVVGEFGVGKTSLIQRYINNCFDVPPPTIGVNYFVKELERESSRIKLKIWDPPGRMSALATFSSCIREADLVVLMYDVTNWKSLDELRTWVSIARLYARDGVRFFLVGAKCDLNNRVVFPRHLVSFCVRNLLQYYEVSALQNLGIEKLFDDIVDELIANPIRVVDYDTVRLGLHYRASCCERCAYYILL